MTSRVLFKRKVGGTGSPGVPGAVEGEIAFAFPAPGTTPELWAFASGAWERVNPPAGAITQQAIDLNTPGGIDVGAAATAWIGANTAFTGDIVLGTWGSPAQAYILTNAAAPGTAASWTSLGGAVAFASAADIHAGTDTIKALNSAVLRGESANTPDGTPANDAGKLLRLSTAGKIDLGFLPAMPSDVRGAIDATAAPPAAPTGGAYKSGDILFANKDGAIDAGWTGATGNIKVGDGLIFDGTNWHVIPNNTDLNAYVPISGSALLSGQLKWAADETGNVVIDCNKGGIDNASIDCGTY